MIEELILFTEFMDEVQQECDNREVDCPPVDECRDWWEDGYAPLEFLDHYEERA